jgi:hypothetical protein
MAPVRRRSWHAFGLVGLTICLSCKQSDNNGPFVGFVTRSQFFEYHDRVDEPLCPTLLSLLDEHAVRIGGKIGLVPDPNRPFRYYKFRDLTDFASNAGCGLDAGGCAPGDTTYSTEYFHAHELAHNYVYRAWSAGLSTGLLNEGAAVALSCDPGYGVQPTAAPSQVLGNPDWRDLLYLHGNSIEGYSAAGFWMTYLAGHFGWPSARELYGRVRPGISAADMEREFARAYPISMDDAWSGALDPPGSPPCDDDWGCMSIPLDVGSDVPPDCDGQMHRSITISDQRGVILTLGGAGSEIILRSCPTAAAPIYELISAATPRTTHVAALPPGTYTLFSDPAPTDVEFVSYLPADFDADTCASSSSISLDPTQVTYVDLLAGSTNGWIRLAGGGHSFGVQPYNLTWRGWPEVSGAPVICDSCDAAATCVTIPPFEVTTVAIGDGAVLRLQGVTAVAASSLYGEVTFLPPEQGDAGQ